MSFSQLSGKVWVPRSQEYLILKLMENVERNGYTVIITHPQEFMREGEVDHLLLSGYRDFIRMLDKTYYLITFSELDA